MEFDVSPNPTAIAAPLGPAADLLTHALDQVANIRLGRLPLPDVIDGWKSGRYACALIPPLDYFQFPDARLIPGLGVFAADDAYSEYLYHRADMDSLRRIAVGEDAAPLAGLAALLVNDLAGVQPEFVPARDTSLEHCDGFLASGLDSMLAEVPYERSLDLQCAWRDRIDGPMPLLVWAAAYRAPYAELRRRLARAAQLGLAHAHEIGARYDQARRLPSGTTERHLTQRLRFSLGSLETDALRQLLQLALRHHAVNPDAAVRFC